MKKFLSIVLTIAMLFGILSIPALAFVENLPDVPAEEGPFGSQVLKEYDGLAPGEIHAVKHVSAIDNEDFYDFEVQLDVLGKGFKSETSKPMMLAILVDLSTSMQNKIDYAAPDANGEPAVYRYNSAEWKASDAPMVMDFLKNALKEFVVKFLANENNRLTIYGWGMNSTVIVDNWSGAGDLASINAAIDGMVPNQPGTNMQQAYHLAGRLFSRVGYNVGFTLADAKEGKRNSSTASAAVSQGLALAEYDQSARLSDVFDAAAIVFTDGCPTASYYGEAVFSVNQAPGSSTTNTWGADYTDDKEVTLAVKQAEDTMKNIPGLDIYNVCTYDGIKELYDEDGTMRGKGELMVGRKFAEAVLDAGFAKSTSYCSAKEIADAFALINNSIEVDNDPGSVVLTDTIGEGFEFVAFAEGYTGTAAYENGVVTWELDVVDGVQETLTFSVKLKEDKRKPDSAGTKAYLTNVHDKEAVTLAVTPTEGNPYYSGDDPAKTEYYVPGNYKVLIDPVTILGMVAVEKVGEGIDFNAESFAFSLYEEINTDGSRPAGEPLATVSTDEFGVATFKDLTTGTTYYVFENLTAEQALKYVPAAPYIEVVAVAEGNVDADAYAFTNNLITGSLTIGKLLGDWIDDSVTGAGTDSALSENWFEYTTLRSLKDNPEQTFDLIAGRERRVVGSFTVTYDESENAATVSYSLNKGLSYDGTANFSFKLGEGSKKGSDIRLLNTVAPGQQTFSMAGTSKTVSLNEVTQTKGKKTTVLSPAIPNDQEIILYLHLGAGGYINANGADGNTEFFVKVTGPSYKNGTVVSFTATKPAMLTDLIPGIYEIEEVMNAQGAPIDASWPYEVTYPEGTTIAVTPNGIANLTVSNREREVVEASGMIAFDKAVVGDDKLEGFAFAAYAAAAVEVDAEGNATIVNGAEPVAGGISDEFGVVKFESKALIPGELYYVFEVLSDEQKALYAFGAENADGYITFVAVENEEDPLFEEKTFYNDYLLGSISGYKFRAYGGYAPDEFVPLEGWTIYLKNIATEETTSMLTGPDGFFAFTDLVPGEYELYEQQETGFSEITDGESVTITIVPGEEKTIRVAHNFVNQYYEGMGTATGMDAAGTQVDQNWFRLVKTTLADLERGVVAFTMVNGNDLVQVGTGTAKIVEGVLQVNVEFDEGIYVKGTDFHLNLGTGKAFVQPGQGNLNSCRDVNTLTFTVPADKLSKVIAADYLGDVYLFVHASIWTDRG